MGIDSKGSYQVIKAKVPLAALDRYSTSLRSLTQGRASFIQRFAEFSATPYEIQQQVVKATREPALV